MTRYQCRILCHAVALIVLLTISAGCVKRMTAANEPAQAEASAFATLKSVTVSADATSVELVSDKPITYTSYKGGDPTQIIVDISQTEPGAVTSPIEVNRGNIKQIEVERQPLGGSVLTHLRLVLTKDVDFAVATDPSDKSRLKIYLPVVEPEAKAEPAEVKEAALSESRIDEKTLSPAAAAAPAVEASAPIKAEAMAAQTAAPAAVPKATTAAVAQPKAGAAPEKSGGAEGGRGLNAVITGADGVDLSIQGGVQTFNSFKLIKPDRIVLDLFKVKNSLPQNVVPVNAFGIANARVGSTPDKVRVVLDAAGDSLPPYEVVKSDLGVKIRLKGKTPAIAKAPAVEAPAAAAAPAPAPATRPAPAPAPATRPVPAPAAAKLKSEVPHSRQTKGALEGIEFKVVDGVSRVSMKLFGTCEPGQPLRGPHGVTLSIANCQVPKQLQRALDTTQFGTPVLSVTPYQVKVKGSTVTKVLVKLRGNPEFSTSRKGDLLLWDFVNPGPVAAPKLPAAPPAPKARAKASAEPRVAEELTPTPARTSDDMAVQLPSDRPAKKVYTGRRVTLEFSDADVRKIFQLIAEVSNLNFLIADDVTGTISIKLVNVPWDQALDVILDAKGLAMVREGNIVQIKPRSKMQNQADEELAAKKAAERLMELKTMVFEVNYASVNDVAMQFGMLKSDRGVITKDERTSRVIVKDIQTALNDMKALLKTLDAPEKQVMIEARIVEATSTFTRDLGVQWGLSYRDGSASVAGINSVDTGFGGVVSAAGPGSSGAGGLGLGMSFGKLTSNIKLDMRLAAAATIGQVKIISTPKVVTLNNKAAKISQGQSIPYQTTSAEGTKTEFVEAALTLEVTPHITADGSVSMKIKASNNSPGTGSPPPINKKEATTELVVSNGDTTVIGGIYVDSDTESDTGVPFLSDIPLLGWLFKSNSKQKTKTELLIFITPKIVL
ncbi:type IV pilus secretin lipoprotein PilQ [Citrifermentans bemidjiense Bem]|uniref:Type IV pilus secretin lipoprotein PilQ n=1 Tax=Citrifermentans bemidjiense (strain ATCC BAA-1014 / DSM 16622 / JCM 12645 / Bem) TaxID=404380 RepID=B5E8I3_CITBB|nr:type IV pilus secretin family protein [Citrifermentans bemidjiense]ACH38568.1 type IV pilus secretin lipoprotein PilQ [Citrifermentans bemidjiense Bem]